MHEGGAARSVAMLERLEPRRLLVVSFPGAEGFGALATGGRGGSVYHVTNLNDSGTGSFRDAVSQSNRTVVFDVGGVITINSQVAFASNITVAGQTAPGGIAVYGDGVSLSNRNNVIIRYMTFRQGIDSGEGDKALNITSGYNIILDHVSIGWGRWDNLGITSNAHDITVQNSLIHEAIDPQRFGSLIDSSRSLSIVRNLWINNQSRNPKGKADMQFINNVIYNWRYGGYIGGHSSAPWNQDLINNYFMSGRSTEGAFMGDFNANDLIYNSGNYLDTNETDVGGDGIPEGSLIADSEFTSRSATIMPSAFNAPAVPVTVMTAQEAFTWVRDNAGNSLHRDGADLRQIQHLSSHGAQGAIIATEATVGGQPPIAGGVAPADTDRDGMPNAYESANGTNPSVADHNGDLNGDGYTNLENYLHSLVSGPGEGAPTVVNPASPAPAVVNGTTTALNVLGDDDGGEANLTYTWSAGGPGAVSFASNGTNAGKNTTAIFTRAGTYAIAVTITDAEGLWTTSSANVTVNAVQSGMSVTPASATITPFSQRQFTAALVDQFGQPMPNQPASFNWSVISGGGTIDSTGLYTAPAGTGSATVRAASAALSADAPVMINPGPAVFQAELGSVGGGTVTESSNAGFNGGGYVNSSTTGGFLQFDNIPGGVGGQATIRFRTALLSGTRSGLLIVNGVSQPITFSATGGWTTWAIHTVSGITLKPGAINTIRLETNGQDLANIDELQVDVPAAIPTTFNGSSAADQYFLRRNGANIDLWIGGNGSGTPNYSIQRSAAPALVFNGNEGNDTLTIEASTAGDALPPGGVTFNGGIDDDLIAVRASVGPEIITFNASSISLGAALNHTGVESRTFDGAGASGIGGDALTITGGAVTLAAAQRLASLDIGAGAMLDVRDFDMIVDYSSVSPVGVWTGDAYDGIAGHVQAGRIVSSQATPDRLRTVAVAEARDALNITGSQTAAFAGHSVDSTSVLLKFTWGGDATLDGKINIDDYGRIDGHVAQSGVVFGWFNGDFNYDGKINIDDYGIIDGNINQQDQIL
jgi:hypothetical protein